MFFLVVPVIVHVFNSEYNKYVFLFLFRFYQLLSLLADGITGAMQDRMRARVNIGGYEMMYNTNIFSSILLLSKFLLN